MTRRGREIAPWIVGAVLMAASCSEGPEQGRAIQPTDRDTPAAAGESAAVAEQPREATGEAAAARAALPTLFGIMLGLEESMRQVSRGLWLESYDSVATAAQAIADHPRVPPEEAEKIAGVLGPDMQRFAALDRDVHDLAVRLRDAARERDLEGVLAARARLDRGCVACHTAFRARLRDGVSP